MAEANVMLERQVAKGQEAREKLHRTTRGVLMRNKTVLRVQQVVRELQALLSDEVMAFASRTLDPSLRVTAVERKASQEALIGAGFEVARHAEVIANLGAGEEGDWGNIAALDRVCILMRETCVEMAQRIGSPAEQELLEMQQAIIQRGEGAQAVPLQDAENPPQGEGNGQVADALSTPRSKEAEEVLAAVLRFSKAHAAEVSFRIVYALEYKGKLTVEELRSAVHQVSGNSGKRESQPTISYHLRTLRESGYVDFREAGIFHYYSLTEAYWRDRECFFSFFCGKRNGDPAQTHDHAILPFTGNQQGD